MWAGTAINDTSSVVAAGYVYSDAAGQFATIVKLTRSLMIVPVTLLLAFWYMRGDQGAQRFEFVKVFPWFIVGFLAAAVLRSMAVVSVDAAGMLGQTGKFLIVMAMAAIGLNTNAQMFVKTGPKALLLGAATWLMVMLSSLLVQYFVMIW